MINLVIVYSWKWKTYSEHDDYNSVNIETGYPNNFDDDFIVYPVFGEFVESMEEIWHIIQNLLKMVK